MKYEYCGEIHTKPLCTIVASIVDYFVYTPVVLCERWPVFVVRCLLLPSVGYAMCIYACGEDGVARSFYVLYKHAV